jgi:hypothetical protein
MKLALVVLLLVVLPVAVQAEGWADLSGKNKAGDLVVPIPAHADHPMDSIQNLGPDSFNIHVFKGGKVSEETDTNYKDKKCKFDQNRDGLSVRFSCAKDGISPLAGVTYKIVPNKDPQDCKYESRFICVSGCGRRDVPLEMIKSYWECGEL